MEWAEQVARMGVQRSEYRILVGVPERWRSLGRPGHRWKDTVKIYHREGMD
jgi:hypothetical protein